MQRQEVAIDGHTEKVNETRYLSLSFCTWNTRDSREKGKQMEKKQRKMKQEGVWIEQRGWMERQREEEREEKRRAADDNGEENFRRVRRWHKSEQWKSGLAERSDAGLRKDLFEIFCCRRCLPLSATLALLVLQHLDLDRCTNNKKKGREEREKEERGGEREGRRNPHPRGDIKKDKLVAARGMAIPKSYGRGVSRNVVLSESGPRFLITGSTLGLAYKLTEIWHVYTYMEISSFHFVEIRFVVASSCSSLPRECE